MRKILARPLGAYGLAVLLTLLASLLAWLIQFYLPKGNLSLVYIAAVIVTAVNTSTRPAIFCALLSFLAFNLMFTEPRWTLRMIHREDVVTALWFLLVASLVGHLAAKLQEKLQILVNKEHFSTLELEFLERLSQAGDEKEILASLEQAVSVFFRRPSEVLPAREPYPEENGQGIFHLQDRQNTVAILKLGKRDGDPAGETELTEDERNSLNILLRQTELALTRARLVSDLASEKLERERELLRSALLSSVSHDFRTPLTAMVGATSTLIEMGDELSREERMELLDSVLSEAKRLDGYAQNLLDMTRIGRGELTLDRSWISVEEIIHVAVKRLRPHLGKLQVKVDIQENLPVLWAHPALLEQALFNVLHNASKFAPPGTQIEVLAFSGSGEESGRVVVEVIDQGPGIPVAEREKVFEMFHTAEQGDRRRAGSGLGLAISKGMIAAHGGAIRIIGADAEGRSGTGGCRVHISLPVIDEEGSDSDERTGGGDEPDSDH